MPTSDLRGREAPRRQRCKSSLGNIGLLDKPFLIWATPPANILDDSSIARGRSWAKINVEQSKPVYDNDGFPVKSLDRLTFYYLWENETGYTVVVDVSAYTTLWGFWQGAGYHYYYKDDPATSTNPASPLARASMRTAPRTRTYHPTSLSTGGGTTRRRSHHCRILRISALGSAFSTRTGEGGRMQRPRQCSPDSPWRRIWW